METILLVCSITSTLSLIAIVFLIYYFLRFYDRKRVESVLDQLKQFQSALTEELKAVKKSIEELGISNTKGLEELKKCLEDVVKL